MSIPKLSEWQNAFEDKSSGKAAFQTMTNLVAGTEEITDGAGAPNGTGVTAEETPSGLRKVVVTFVDTPVVMVDEGGVVAFGSLKIYDLPEGAILFQGATADLALTLSAAGINADWDGDFALGTVAASNNATLTATEDDLLPSTATPQASGSATTATGLSTTSEVGTVFDGTSTAVDAYLNIIVDDADHDVTGTPTNIIVNGTITLYYANLGDF